jgi:hypothetical protein
MILLAALDSTVVLVALISAILSGGTAAGYVALRKAPAEIESVAVGTLRDALAAQSGVLDELRAELGRKEGQIAELHSANGELRHRVAALEDTLRNGISGSSPA